MLKRTFLFYLLLNALFLSACQRSSSTQSAVHWNGMDLTGGISKESLGEWKLPSTRSDQAPLGVSSFYGQPVLVFFGYAQCPDICPTTLAKLARIRRQLGQQEGEKAQRFQVLFITVDPERDHLPFLQRYVAQFDPTFIGLRGTPEETRKVADRFKVFFQKNPLPAGGYTVDHSAGVYMIDTRGELRELLPDTLSDQLARDDIRQLLSLNTQ